MADFKDNISRYLKFLQKEGWSDLICRRWKDRVYEELIKKFPNMSEEEWKRLEKVLFI